MGEEVNTERTKYGLMTVTHMHDCDKCVFIGASHSGWSKTTDWYVCGGSMPTIIGRHSSEPSDNSSYDPNTLCNNIKHPSLIKGYGEPDSYEFSESLLVAYMMYNLWREKQ
jgi:hypothetical protein